jgi:hypothetical protein
MDSPKPSPSPDAWQSTRALTGMATRVMGAEDYLGRDAPQVGTPVGENRHEIFAVCPPAEALQMQLQEHTGAFIALHDVGATRQRSLLAELAAALRLAVQSLVIRRQGYGVTLATIPFIELPAAKGTPVRIYSGTDVDADSASRRPIDETLLAFSRLGVLLVPALPAHVLDGHFKPLRERLLTQPWSSRQLLVVPTASGVPSLAELARRLVAGTTVAATTTPAAAQVGAIWSVIQGAWNVARGVSAATPSPAAPVMPATPQEDAGAAISEAMPLRPMPSPHGQRRELDDEQISRYVQTCARIKGVIGCCVFNIARREPLAHGGRLRHGSALAAQGAALIGTAAQAGSYFGGAVEHAETLVTLEHHMLLARVLHQQPALALLAVFDRKESNPLTLRAQLQRLEPILDAAGPAARAGST